MRRRLRFGLIAALLPTAAQSAFAGQVPQLSLEEAVRIALENNRSIAAAGKRAAARDWPTVPTTSGSADRAPPGAKEQAHRALTGRSALR